jgi:hypothetical protein
MNTDDFLRYTRSYLKKHPDEAKAIKQEHLGRIAQGKDVWNAWADEFKAFIDQQERGRKEGQQNDFVIDLSEIEIDCNEHGFAGFGFPCRTNFFGTTFSGKAGFRNTTFSGFADFRDTTFSDLTSFSDTTFSGKAGFRNTTFSGFAGFRDTTFSGFADFSDTTFSDLTSFSDTIFSGEADFSDATFSNFAFFRDMAFSRDASFSDATFSNFASFSDTTFSGFAEFFKSTFSGGADFRKTTFSDTANFNMAKYKSGANFENAKFESLLSFNKARFNENVPEFNYAVFKQAPHLSGMEIPEPRSVGAKPYNLVERYRKLKDMAQSSKDHENELKFFGYETHAKLFLTETPLLSKCLIRAYHLVSNFGQSVKRPLFSLLLFLLVMMLLINPIMITPNWKYCIESSPNKPGVNKFRQVATYTLTSSLPLVTIDNQQREVMNKCLFGDRSSTDNPKTLKHSFWRLVHLLPSSVLLFLFGLGLRNRFKIK